MPDARHTPSIPLSTSERRIISKAQTDRIRRFSQAAERNLLDAVVDPPVARTDGLIAAEVMEIAADLVDALESFRGGTQMHSRLADAALERLARVVP